MEHLEEIDGYIISKKIRLEGKVSFRPEALNSTYEDFLKKNNDNKKNL